MLVLARHYEAHGASDIEQLRQMPLQPGFDLVLLCHTLSLAECEMATRIARSRWPQVRVMALSNGISNRPITADEIVPSTDGPVALLRYIDQMILT